MAASEQRSSFLRASAVFLSFAFWIASTSSFFFISDRPETSSFLATFSRWSLVALASTPPLVSRFVLRPPPACASEGPFLPPALLSQWSPTFSKLCLTAAQATWLARRSSPYSSAAASCAFANVRWAFLGERRSVLGSSDCLALAPLRGLRHDLSSRVGRPLPRCAAMITSRGKAAALRPAPPGPPRPCGGRCRSGRRRAGRSSSPPRSRARVAVQLLEVVAGRPQHQGRAGDPPPGGTVGLLGGPVDARPAR